LLRVDSIAPGGSWSQAGRKWRPQLALETWLGPFRKRPASVNRRQPGSEQSKGTIFPAPMLSGALKTTRSRHDDPLCLLWGLFCSFRSCWASLGYGGMRRWLSQHVRRSVRPRRMAGSYARSQRVPGHIPANSPLRPVSPMESAIHDVCSHLNRPRAEVHLPNLRPGIAFPSEHDLEPTLIQAESNPADHGRDGCYVQVSL
jgi:hypothetical protein